MIIKHEGQDYLKVGNKAMLIGSYDKDGKPVIKVETENITYPDGRKDVKVHVHCLSISSNN